VAKTSRWHRVAIDDTEAAWLMAHWEREQPGRQDWERDYLITAGDQTNEGARLRAACVFKRVNAWMRTLGWTTGHTIHELRALYARLKQAQVGAAAMAGLKAAAGDLGHSGTAVTEQHYTGGNSLERNNVVQFPGRKVA
jgi:hypothetical protein